MSRPLTLVALIILLAGCAHARQGEAVPQCVPREFPLVVTLGEHETAPGAVDTLRVREYRGHFGPHELPSGCRPVWWIAAGAPATLSPATGVLRVDPSAPDGATFPVSVRVAQQTVETTVRIVDRARSPLVGRWTEVARTRCGATEAEPPGENPLRELIFHGNGSFTVTWTPFESYTDYWGTYTYEPRTGRLRLWVEGGNRLPPQRDLDGRALLNGEDELHLVDLWLGSYSPSSRPACHTTFRRQGRPPPGPGNVQSRDHPDDLHQPAHDAAAVDPTAVAASADATAPPRDPASDPAADVQALPGSIRPAGSTRGADSLIICADRTAPIRLRTGDTFTVLLKSNPTTGYEWALGDSLPPAVLSLALSRYEQDPGPRMPGRGGQERWTFQALGAGSAIVSLVYRRQSGPPAKVKRYHVIVE